MIILKKEKEMKKSLKFLTSIAISSMIVFTSLQCNAQTEATNSKGKKEVLTVQAERDEIYTLLSYSVVLKNWQNDSVYPKRGHNIGCVLVDDNGNVVEWARNSNHITSNGTQHGEVRVMQKYLNKIKRPNDYYLKDYSIYTTLEPCAMCSGMMVLTKVARTVYGQTDEGFGKGLERLALDSRELDNGHAPYPRKTISDASPCKIRVELDRKFIDWQEESPSNYSITGFLRTDTAKASYEKALDLFLNYEVQNVENKVILEKAQNFYNDEVSDYYEGEINYNQLAA